MGEGGQLKYVLHQDLHANADQDQSAHHLNLAFEEMAHLVADDDADERDNECDRTDYGSGDLWSLTGQDDIWQFWPQPYVPGRNYSAFGEDSSGELYVADDGGGSVYRIELVAMNHVTYLPVQRKE